MSVRDLTLPGGRAVRVWWSGPAELTLVHHPGTPGGLTPEPELVDAATGAGVGLLVLARPGYGGSSRLPGRTVGSVAADARDVLAILGCRDLVTSGWSGGGPHALACAARLPGCRAAAALASVAPFDAGDLDPLAGMAPENLEEFALTVEGEAALRPWMEVAAQGMTAGGPDELMAALGELLPPVDRAALGGPRAAHFVTSTREALSGGVDGWLDDDLAFVRPWGFDPADVTVPVAVWQGEQDTMVPIAHGRWLAARIPTARPHLLPGEGHLSLVLDHAEEIVRDLVDLAR